MSESDRSTDRPSPSPAEEDAFDIGIPISSLVPSRAHVTSERPPLFPGSSGGGATPSALPPHLAKRSGPIDVDPGVRVALAGSEGGGTNLLKAVAKRKSLLATGGGSPLGGTPPFPRNQPSSSSPSTTSPTSPTSPQQPQASSSPLLVSVSASSPRDRTFPDVTSTSVDTLPFFRSPSPNVAETGSLASRRHMQALPAIVVREPSSSGATAKVVLDVGESLVSGSARGESAPEGGEDEAEDEITAGRQSRTTAGTGPSTSSSFRNGGSGFSGHRASSAATMAASDVEVEVEEDGTGDEDASGDEVMRASSPESSIGIPLDEEAGEAGFRIETELEEHRKSRRRKDGESSGKKKKKKKKRSHSHKDGRHRHRHRHHDDHHDEAPKRKKFSLAPRNWVDRLLFFWGFRLLNRVRRHDDIHDVALHLKSSESAKFTGDTLERTWNEEVERCRLLAKRYGLNPNDLDGSSTPATTAGSGSTSGSDPLIPGTSTRTVTATTTAQHSAATLGDVPDAAKDVEMGKTNTADSAGAGGSGFAGTGAGAKRTEWSSYFGLFKDRRKKCRPRLYLALNRAFGLRFSLLAIWKALWAVFTWLGAYGILKYIIAYCEARENSEKEDGSNAKPWPLYQGHLLALGLFLSSSFSSICFHQLAMQCMRIGVQCRAALMVLVYRKSLKLSYVKGGVGDIVNLISNECNRVAEASVNWHYIWSAILECAIIIALAFYDIGLAAFPAMFLIMFILLPLQFYIAMRSSEVSLQSTGLITKRVHLMSEILTAIKLIKFYAWESFFAKKISRARLSEMNQLRNSMLLRASNCMLVFIAPVVATLACLLVAIYHNPESLTAGSVFTLLSLFNTLRYPLLLLPNAVRTFQGCIISFQHLEDFFNLPEVEPLEMLMPPEDDPDLLLDVVRGFTSRVDDTDLMRGQLIAVVGDLSSGKSLLAAILGQVKRTTGSVMTYGTFGYAPQEPWLINATIRDNILFGLEYDDRLYVDVIRLCGLTRDLMLLSNGDESVVSDLNLSASQRQRLSLARCLYHNPDMVLIEDCLSDFDQSHTKRLFKECIRNNLLKKGKAVVLVTQQKQFLPECDLILVLKGDRVVESGTFTELKARKVNFAAWVSDYVPIDDDPSGVLDGVNEIRLDGPPTGQGTVSAATPFSPVSNPVSRFVSATGKGVPVTPGMVRSPFAQGRIVHQHKPSPLATADVITEPLEMQSVGPETDPGQMTIRAIMALNQQSIQNAKINEQTISKMIERNQLSVLTGNPTRPPANFPNQDPVTRTIEVNQLTVHSVLSFDPASAAGDKAIVTRTSFSPLMAYDMYLREGYGRIVGIGVLMLFFLVHGIRFLSDYWLKLFIDDQNDNQPREYYMGIYGGLTAAIAIGVFARSALFSKSVLKKSTTLHDRCLDRVLRAPMSFYDVTPLGQVLSNFARHLFLVDESLPDAALQVLSFAPIPLGTLVLVAAIVPYFWVTLPLYFALSAFLVWKCAHAEKKLRTLEASNKSPMFTHLSTTLEGLFSIRLYCAQDRFDAFNRILIDADHKALYSLMVVNVVQALYLDLISSFAIYMTALLIIASKTVNGTTAGLAISNVLQLLLFVHWMVRMGMDVHMSMTSVAAVTSFTDHVPVEILDGSRGVTPPEDWPSQGTVEFKHVTLRYHRYGIAVLKSVSFRFNAGEKIGIVGRSGSGKTTLLVALMRIVDNIEGEIFVDDIDISTLSLSHLRSRIAVIPQEPVLLTGTIRTNLDPFGFRTDEEVWKAVRDVHLGAKIESMPLKLNTPISENGRAFSLAERQLFCVARAILMKTRIVIFDEPTTAADNETDALIQSTIHDNFKDATVIVLASRFRMIAQTDRIVVMDGGKIVESDTPVALLDNPRSKLSLMISQTGDVDLGKLRHIAHTRAEARSSLHRSLKPASVSSHAGSGAINGVLHVTGSVVAANPIASASSPTLSAQVGVEISEGSYDSHSSVSTLGSTHSGVAAEANAALRTTSSGNSALAVQSSSSTNGKKPGAMPKSLEGIFGDTAQLERQKAQASASSKIPPPSPISPTVSESAGASGVGESTGASSASK
ncbi:Multidrug resistance-associated protein 1 [Phlyctochytrium bullatum]|nr:Multidrug resistance-associated protein 1 [Phlyctochytrium bullatum]